MPQTPNRDYSYPEGTDTPDVPYALERLALELDRDVQSIRNAAVIGRDAVESASADNDPYRLVRRGGDGRFAVPDPEGGTHVANKSYVDTRASSEANTAERNVRNRMFAAITSQLSIPAGGNVEVTVTLPAGQFSSAVPTSDFLQDADNARCATQIRLSTASRTTVRVNNFGSQTAFGRVLLQAIENG